MIIPFHKPTLPDDFSSIFSNSVKDGWLTTGSVVKKFESDLKHYTNFDNIVAVNSCTAALHLALAAKGFSKGDKYIAPTYTFVATVEVGEYLSMHPLLVDSNKNNFNLDLNIVEDYLIKDPSIKAVIPVHFSGEPVNKSELLYLSEKYNVFILEDSAHALESSALINENHNTNSAVAFSFYANKNITTGGEGGALATQNIELAKKVRQLSLHGMSKDGWNRFKDSKKWRYDVSDLGYKYNMTDISASFGIDQLLKVNDWRNKRISIVKCYAKELRKIDGIICPENQFETHSWHLYIIRFLTKKWRISRDQMILELNKKGIGTSVHYIPVHMHSYYIKKYDLTENDFPNASEYSNSVISLPLYPMLENQQVLYIINVIEDLWSKFKI